MELEQIPEIVGQTIDTMASKLEVPAGKIMDLMVTGTVFEGTVAMYGLSLLMVLVLALSVVFIVLCALYAKKSNDTWVMCAIIALIGLGGAFGIATEIYKYAIMAYMPNYYLLTEIFSKLG